MCTASADTLKVMQLEKHRSPRSFTVLVGLVYLLLIVVLGLILFKLYNSPTSEELIAGQSRSAAGQTIQTFEMLETQQLTISDHELPPSKPYDPWSNRPVVNSPRMPAGGKRSAPNPWINQPPVIHPPFAYSTQPPANQPPTICKNRCCRCVRIYSAKVEGGSSTPVNFSQSKGLQETTLPITNQP